MTDALTFALAFALALWGLVSVRNATNPRNSFETWMRVLAWAWAIALFTAAYHLAPLG